MQASRNSAVESRSGEMIGHGKPRKGCDDPEIGENAEKDFREKVAVGQSPREEVTPKLDGA